jgi:ComF family protein
MIRRLRRGLALFRDALATERRCAACASVFSPPPPPSARADPAGPASFCCPSCADRLAQRREGYCPLCGALSPWPQAPSGPCSACLAQRPPWVQAFFHAPYEDLLRDLLLRFKFQGQIALALPLGTLLASHPGLAACPADLILPIPLPGTRLARRGFNQALELARPLARLLRKPLSARLLLRSRHTEPQPGLSRRERFANLALAFSAPRSPDLQGRRVLLVDDIMTTGATFSAATEALLTAGARSVAVAALARTPEIAGK